MRIVLSTAPNAGPIRPSSPAADAKINDQAGICEKCGYRGVPEQESCGHAQELVGFVSGKKLDRTIDGHRDHKSRDPQGHDNKRIHDQRNDVTDEDPGASRADWKLISFYEKTPLRQLVASCVFRTEFHPE